MARIGLTPAQCRAARNAVGMSQRRLAEEAAVSVPVVQEFEGRERTPMEKNLRDIRDALIRAGVQFRTVSDGIASITFADENARLVEPQDGASGK